MIIFLFCIMTIFGITIVLLLAYIRRLDGSLADMLQPSQAIRSEILPYSSSEMKLIGDALLNACASDKLLLARSLMGSNYRAQVRIIGDVMEIEALGESTIETPERRSFG